MMREQRFRRDVTALVTAIALVALVCGCVPDEGAGLETFFRDLALNAAAAFLL